MLLIDTHLRWQDAGRNDYLLRLTCRLVRWSAWRLLIFFKSDNNKKPREEIKVAVEDQSRKSSGTFSRRTGDC
ncbi:hypothetical protein AMELA_G00082620 [Ameiurus melas]|uniref:Uncharacterized protein n=1 Tax=Ameiurus melas TaxID=219545 RepID=A0A7J6B0F6_AMEME|nr:hypothetical protein AMELA_G00082620 [Ameiurus melas]